MGKNKDKWIFWKPFVFGALSLIVLAAIGMGVMKHRKQMQRDYVNSLKEQSYNPSLDLSASDDEIYTEISVEAIRESALAKLDEPK